MPHTNPHKGFTLIELLIVIGILAVLATVTLLVINPAQMIKQSRDANRLTEIKSMNQALLLYQAFGGSTSMGTHGYVYVSIPCDDPNFINLPNLLNGYSYACSTRTNYRNIDGTGWIPVDFTSVQSSAGSLFSNLPIDPINTVANGYYYTYIPGSWALSATMESEKYLADNAVNDGGGISTRFEAGNNLNLDVNLPESQGTSATCGNNVKEGNEVCDGTDLNSQTCATRMGTGYTGTLSCNTGCTGFNTSECVAPWTIPASGLIAHWKFDEGSGDTAYDSSGNNNTVTLHGATWTTDSKVGSHGLYFDNSDSSNQYYAQSVPITIPAGDFTFSVWYKAPSSSSSNEGYLLWDANLNYIFDTLSYNGIESLFWECNTYWRTSPRPSRDNWHYIVTTFENGSPCTFAIYVDGTSYATTSSSCSVSSNTGTIDIGANSGSLGSRLFIGDIDEVAIYTRALSSSEVSDIYDHQK